jgi:methionyl-tRNA formyltransferase
MRVVAIVNAYTGALCLQELVDQGEEVVAVVTAPGDPQPGAPLENSVKLTADRNYLPVYQPPIKDVNSPRFVEILRRLAPDLIVSMHFALIFRPELLAIPRLGCVNEHPSRMPAGRGMTPSWWHMLVGDDHNWVTLHYLDSGIDTGDVISQGSVPITAADTGHTTSRKLSQVGHRLLAEALPLLREGRAPRTPQKQVEGVKSSYFSWKPWMARIAWEKPAGEVVRQIRCLTHPKDEPSWTGCAYTYLAGERLSVWNAREVEAGRWGRGPGEPGEIVAVTGEGLVVKAGQGQALLADANLDSSPGRGIVGILPLLGGHLPVVLA